MKGKQMMELILHKGRPITKERRLDKEVRCYDLLDSLGIEYERVDHELAMTIEACAAIDEVLGDATICNSLHQYIKPEAAHKGCV